MEFFMPVQSHFISRQGNGQQHSRIPYMVVDNFIDK